jgi:hypothetical protein
MSTTATDSSKVGRHPLVILLLVTLILTILVSRRQNYERIPLGLVVVDTPNMESSSVEVPVVTTERTFDWSQVKSRLCRNGLPDTSLGEKLFSLARKALLNSDNVNSTEIVEDVHNKRMVDTFYNGFFSQTDGASLYMSSHHGNNESSMIYIEVWKCGSNFIRQWLQNVFKNATLGEFVKDIHPKKALSLLQARKRPITPCVVTAIRDPIVHFLSGYNEMEYRIWQHIDHPKSSPPPVYLELSFETENDRRQRFKEFVSNVLYDDFDKFKGLAPRHILPPSRILSELSKLGLLQLTTYLPSTVNLTFTWPQFLATACPGLSSSLHAPTRDPAGMGVHDSSLDEMGFYRAAKDVWAEQGDTARALCILHSFDYACWDDLPDGIPEICQDVYSEERFLDTIMNTSIIPS